MTRPPGRLAALVAALALTAAAVAQGPLWSVQTVALRDYREAQAAAQALTRLGLPAYTEFTMAGGLQYVRVRVGCVDTREVADAWAAVVAPALAPEAVPVLIEGGASAVPCVAADIGFRTPGRWALVSGPDAHPVFEVEVAGHRAYLSFDGSAWRVWQGVPPPPSAAPAARVVAARLEGHDVVRAADGRLLCPGRLLAAVGDAAVVALGDAVVACRPTAVGGP